MRTDYKKTTTKELIEMLRARLQGKSFPIIGLRFNKDHSTIIYWCKKFNVKPISFADGEEKREITLISKDNLSNRSSIVPIKITLIVKRDFSIEKAKKYFFKDILKDKESKDFFDDQKIIMQKDPLEQKQGDGIKTCYQCGKKKKNKKWIRTRYCSLSCWFTFVSKGVRKRFY